MGSQNAADRKLLLQQLQASRKHLRRSAVVEHHPQTFIDGITCHQCAFRVTGQKKDFKNAVSQIKNLTIAGRLKGNLLISQVSFFIKVFEERCRGFSGSMALSQKSQHAFFVTLVGVVDSIFVRMDKSSLGKAEIAAAVIKVQQTPAFS